MPLLFYLWIAFALNYIDRQMVYSMFPALKRDLGFSPLALAWVGTLFLWSYTLALPFAGALADRRRRDRLILASLILWSIATLGCGLANSVWSFNFWRTFMGLTEALYYPTALALLSTHYPEAQRSRALGIHQSAQLVGIVLGGYYGGWAADHTGWRSAFLYAGAAGLVYSFVLQRVLPVSHGARALPTPQQAHTSLSPRRPLHRHPPFLALCGAFSAFCSIQWIFFAWFPTFLQERFQLSMTDSGWNATLFVQGATIIGILIGGAIADRLRRHLNSARLYVAAAGVLLAAPFAYLAFTASTLNEARAYSFTFGIFAGSLATNAFAAAFDLVTEDARGLAAGVLNCCGGIASGAMILLAGLYKDTYGFGPMLLAASSIAILTALLLVALAPRLGPNPQQR